MSEAYSASKAGWHIDRIAQLRTGRDIAPVHLHFVISDLCNQDCHFCAYRMGTGFTAEGFAEDGNRNPARFIPTDKAKEILDDCAELGVQAIEFTGGGEPTVHADHIEIFAHAQALGLRTGLVTNGVRLKEHAVYSQLDWIRVSLDAGTAVTYEQIRASKAWPKVMANLRMESIKRPYFGVGFVVTRENYAEIVQATEIALDAGADYIRFSAMFSTDGSDHYEGLRREIDALRVRAASMQTDTFKVVDLFGDRINDLDQGAPEYSFCGQQQFVLYVGGDQKLYRCCTTAYTKHGLVADLRDQRFKDALAATNRFGFDARSCHHCQFNDKNRVVAQLLDPNPPHVYFV